MEKLTCTFLPAIQCTRRLFHSLLKETKKKKKKKKKINNQFLNKIGHELVIVKL